MSTGTTLAIPPRPYLRDEVYRALRARIAEVAEGADDVIHLREATLARELGVSRTPVREALNRLHQEGLVRYAPRRGARIVPATMDEYLCWLEVRETLEGMAARRAAARATPAFVAELRGVLVAFEADAPDIAAFAAANVRFHALIVEAADATLLTRLSETYSHLANARRRITARAGRVVESTREHAAIVAAIERNDAAAAEAAARAHVRNLRASVAERLTRLDP